MDILQQTIEQITQPDQISMRAMQHRLNQLTKPLGSLGELEHMAVRLAGIQGKPDPKLERKAVVVMCGDHGVTEEGVSAYPSAVTGLMMGNFVRGGAAINVLSRQFGAEVCVVDVGSRLDPTPEGIVNRKVRGGTNNMAKGPAMSGAETLEAIQTGIKTAHELADQGIAVMALGEMGIGNTTPSSAMSAVFTGRSVSELTGTGTGLEQAALNAKIAVIEKAIRINKPDPADPLDVIAKVGGLEIAALVGVILGAAARKVAVVIDGVITGAAALAAFRLEPRCKAYMFASHLSVEPAHRILLEELGLRPLLHLGMRLGEGTGAALAFPLMEAALKLTDEMATFADLGLPSPAPEPEA
ncbi:nicotinate-nucleotide--dimethylbenzimidazole phosphoribosyltransferase [Paenibacillus thalictri]|uniref:Nicotinate-nucleotide--dimethylbenzimidazole phosphoribosyltransferase n=1 Tax=Paenibacillus thalictri TaxID=2527873 RepID=A0A4Q9DRK6_9BACL|nr:nicotinate-nucleotide--dimethylbenzimidazole phosphoribosyltransferase [Paenibacillus thalictri]TBL78271.1 nicotinate-nucleotide--dimethylbenzimidazole phosphoribosyltransferase [Paenibacillus thalictri]